MKRLFLILSLLVIPFANVAQEETVKSKFSFNSDFRFRVEQDWDSKKSDGTFREDRTRFRYRLRAGATYTTNRYEVAFALRTGKHNKQQDPQLTLGDGPGEFGILALGIDKAYFKAKWNTFSFWVGKNTFPFEKTNELFWSDNVNPEGLFVEKSFFIESSILDSFQVKGGHYIVATSNKSLDKDAYFQGFQITSSLLNKRLSLFPSLYLFKNLPNIPDGNDTFLLNYAILHFGSKLKVLNDQSLYATLDYYSNLQDYNQLDEIPQEFKDQKTGLVIGLNYGTLKAKGDWFFSTSYANLERYSAVDFLAQNDWARWDYSSSGSPDGRLTNFKGVELVVAHKIDKKINLKVKYYFVNQLVPFGITKETGSRIRFDIDVKF